MIRLTRFHSFLIPAWAVLIAGGFCFLLKYETTPGRAAAAETRWPAGATSLVPFAGKSTLIMAAHPECPCSRATLTELAELTAKYPNRLACYVLFVPAGSITAADCRASALWQQAAAIPGVTPLVDQEKLSITSFHAHTSGQVLLYDAAGNLQFSGGVTAARDHAGPSDGTDAITLFLTTGKATPARTPVFGCSLE